MSPRVVRALSYALVLLVTLLLALWGAFLVPLRVRGQPLPLGLLLALATVPLCWIGGRVLQARRGAAGPAVVWALTALALSSQRREGDLVVTGGALGVGFLLLGLLGAAVAVGLWRPVASPAEPGSRDTRGGAGEP